MLCGAAPFEYVVLDDECELDECDDFDTVSSFCMCPVPLLCYYFVTTLLLLCHYFVVTCY